MTDNRGFSLLEVIIALAFLTGALAVLGELVSMGVEHAMRARNLTQAELLCESKMAEIVSGMSPAEDVSSVPFEPYGLSEIGEQTLDENIEGWLYSIETDSLTMEGLTTVCVTVHQDLPPEKRPVTFSLVRWISAEDVLATTEEPPPEE